jgi:hypothetical protein
LEEQVLNDNLVEVQIRFKVTTNLKYAYFDDAMLQGRYIYEYLLPDNFRDGHLSSVLMQASHHMDEACYDLNSFSSMSPGTELDFDIVDEGSQRYLKVNNTLTPERRLRLTGYKPLESLSSDSDTITLDSERVPLLIARAEMIFFERYRKPVSSSDITRYNFEYGTARTRFNELFTKLRMSKPVELLRGYVD